MENNTANLKSNEQCTYKLTMGSLAEQGLDWIEITPNHIFYQIYWNFSVKVIFNNYFFVSFIASNGFVTIHVDLFLDLKPKITKGFMGAKSTQILRLKN